MSTTRFRILRSWTPTPSCWIFVALASFGLGCGGSSAASAPDGGGAGGAGGAAGTDGGYSGPVGGAYRAMDADALFGWPTVPVFSFTMPADQWAYLQVHAVDEQYQPASTAFEGNPLGTTGLRFKGSYGSLRDCFDASGKLTCAKLSMKADFSQYDPDGRFFGLKRINFNSMVNDPSKLHERLAYDLYRQMGVVAPRAAWAVVEVNGQSLGLFSMVEEIDGRFTKDRFPSGGNGNLYKEVWPVSADPAYYAAGLETNATTATSDAFVAFHAALAAAATPVAQVSALGTFTDPGYLARYMAVDDAIENVDGTTAFYCDSSGSYCHNHNYYWYQTEGGSTFQLIPWDLDATFTSASSFGIVPHWTVAPDCSVRYAVWLGGEEVIPSGCDPIFQALGANLDAYHQAVATLLAGPFSDATLTAEIQADSDFIASAVAADPLLGGEAGWRAAVASLSEYIGILRQRLAVFGQGYQVTPFQLAISGVNDFEATDELGILLGVSALSNPQSTVNVGLGTTAPIEGAQDFRVDFEYRNEPPPDGAWQQWSQISLSYAGGPYPLDANTGLRLTVKTDRPRQVRIDLVSPAQLSGSQGIRFGWTVSATSTPKVFALPFADAMLPTWAPANSPDVLADVVAEVTGIDLQPLCTGQLATGYLPDETTDLGWLEIDAVEVY